MWHSGACLGSPRPSSACLLTRYGKYFLSAGLSCQISHKADRQYFDMRAEVTHNLIIERYDWSPKICSQPRFIEVTNPREQLRNRETQGTSAKRIPSHRWAGDGRNPQGGGSRGVGDNRFSKNLTFECLATKFFCKVSRRFLEGQKGSVNLTLNTFLHNNFSIWVHMALGV